MLHVSHIGKKVYLDQTAPMELSGQVHIYLQMPRSVVRAEWVKKWNSLAPLLHMSTCFKRVMAENLALDEQDFSALYGCRHGLPMLNCQTCHMVLKWADFKNGWNQISDCSSWDLNILPNAYLSGTNSTLVYDFSPICPV